MKLVRGLVFIVSLSILMLVGVYLFVQLIFFTYGLMFKPLPVDAYKPVVSSLEVVSADSSSIMQADYIGDYTGTEYLQPVCGQWCLENGTIK